MYPVSWSALTAGDYYGSYHKSNINEEDTIRLHDDGDLVRSTISYSQKIKGAYELTYKEIVNLLDITPIAEVYDVSDIDDLTIEEIAKHIQQMMDESNKLNETLLTFKQALIKKNCHEQNKSCIVTDL